MKKRIVVADDFDNTRWVIEFSLRTFDCEILKAANGKEALAYFDGSPIDLLITDLNMPEMNGIELVKNVKNIPQYNMIPVIMLTTETNPELKERALGLHITMWMLKPFKNEEFAKVVKRCLSIN